MTRLRWRGLYRLNIPVSGRWRWGRRGGDRIWRWYNMESHKICCCSEKKLQEACRELGKFTGNKAALCSTFYITVKCQPEFCWSYFADPMVILRDLILTKLTRIQTSYTPKAFVLRKREKQKNGIVSFQEGFVQWMALADCKHFWFNHHKNNGDHQERSKIYHYVHWSAS